MKYVVSGKLRADFARDIKKLYKYRDAFDYNPAAKFTDEDVEKCWEITKKIRMELLMLIDSELKDSDDIEP